MLDMFTSWVVPEDYKYAQRLQKKEREVEEKERKRMTKPKVGEERAASKEGTSADSSPKGKRKAHSPRKEKAHDPTT